MKPEKEHLLNELLDGEPGVRREATLLAGTRLLRRRRQWRTVSRGLSLLSILLASGFWLEKIQTSKPVNPPLAQAKIIPILAQPQSLTDDQLLALFPQTPVGLVPLAHGKKRLFFPRPTDERKFVNRL